MKIDALELRNFRNYQAAKFEFQEPVNLFVGKNGQGKSNLLEAIELVLTGSSFRPSQPGDFILTGSPNRLARVSAVISTGAVKKDVEIRVHDLKREILINGKGASRQTLRKIFSSVVFTPDSLAVVKQGPQERRQLFDQVMGSLDPENVNLLQAYAEGLKARNRLLRDALDNHVSRSEAHPVLESLNQVFLPLAANLTVQRLRTIEALGDTLRKVLRTILNSPNVDISVDYVISEKSAIAWSPNQVYDALKSRLGQLYEAELSSGQSLVGPHKHDVQFLFNGQDARYFCSQGQQRSIALAVKIAQIIVHQKLRGEYPVLLLDDVFSELDAEKRECLLGILRDIPAQIFLTTAEIEDSRQIGLPHTTTFQIENGNAR